MTKNEAFEKWMKRNFGDYYDNPEDIAGYTLQHMQDCFEAGQASTICENQKLTDQIIKMSELLKKCHKEMVINEFSQTVLFSKIEDVLNGEVKAYCKGCGSTKSLNEIRSRGFKSCCPDRFLIVGEENNDKE